MTGSPLAPVIIPVVVVIVLAAWLALVFYADAHPGHAARAAAAERGIASETTSGDARQRDERHENTSGGDGSHPLRSRMARTLAANPRELRPSGQPHDTPSANLPPRWADRQDGSGELGAPGWLDPGGISMIGGLGIWRTKSLLSGASCRSFSAWSGGGVRDQEQPGGRWLLVLWQRGERGDVMAWLIVLAAGLFETGFAVLLKLSHGLTKLWPTAGFAACALISFALLTVALRELEVGAAYAVWTGIGAAGAAAVGMIFLGDAVSALKLVSIGLVLAGVVGLNLSGVTPS